MASSSKVLVVRPVRSNMLSHAKEQTHFPKWNAFFYWPESGPVTVPSWLNHEDLHEDFGWCGWLWGKGYYTDWCSSRYPDKVLVVEVEASDITTTKSGKIKFTEGNVIFCGTFETVTKFMKERGHTGMVYGIDKDPNNSKAIVGDGGTAVAGDNGEAEAGYYGKATAGVDGKATTGDYGVSKVGDGGTAISGVVGTSIAGADGTALTGYSGKATAGDGGTALVASYRHHQYPGDGGTAEAGHNGKALGPDYGSAVVGDGGTAVAGYCGSAKAGKNGKALAGDQGFAEAGENGYVVVGENGTAIVGMGGVAMAGVGGSITIHWASKLGTAYTTTGKAFVGPNYYGDVERIESDVPYCIKKGRLVIAES